MLTGFSQEDFGHITRHGLHLTLTGNPFLCSCASSGLHRFLRDNYASVEEHQNLTLDCQQEARSLFSMEEEEFCLPLPLLPILLSSSLLLILLLLLVLLRIFYRDTIIIWVFSKSWGKVFFSEDEIDREKPYDAFLSYSEEDSKFVEDDLLPGLESPDNPRNNQYKCLIHKRDWNVGEEIFDQIVDSVASSRRTVVVLSKHFLESAWSKLELRAAVSKTKKENTQRVILLLHGDLPPTEDLPPELQPYIKSHTAIRTDDPWFWQRLRYALPRVRERQRSPSAGTQSTLASEGQFEKEESRSMDFQRQESSCSSGFGPQNSREELVKGGRGKVY